MALLAAVFLFPACTANDNADPRYQDHVSSALQKIDLTIADLSLPKLGRPHSTPGRQPAVDKAMKTPLSMIVTGARLSDLNRQDGSLSFYQAELLATVGYSKWRPSVGGGQTVEESRYISKLEETELLSTERQLLADLVVKLATIAQQYREQHEDVDSSSTEAILTDIRRLIPETAAEQESRRLSLDEYHETGKTYSVEQEAGYLLLCLEEIEAYIRSTHIQVDESITWDTPLGRIRIAGDGDDTHSGHFFLLIDTGGDDHYQDVGSEPPQTGFTFVIDRSGNDSIAWKDAPGPGAGVFGIGVWADLQGDDVYRGRNVGLGVGLFGAGALWDKQGNDVYRSGSLSQGAGQYGIGLLIDGAGDDRFIAELSSQGYGGTGGLGGLISLAGNDDYQCGNVFADQSEARIQRHKETHYISMCQGYSFGRRPEISGGVGLLIDHAGNDTYQGDIFAQGSSYWFGLGMLIDSSGNDTYSAFEHAQGESLHLGAGFLGDYGGNDGYTAYEHSQGAGIDRAIGILLDTNGDDSYQAVKESQGAGIKPFGIGILIDARGNDSYASRLRSQGYSKTLPAKFPADQWPVGVFLDLGGDDGFALPYVDPIGSEGRIQNRQGIAVNYSG